LAALSYFTEWGSWPWERLLALAFDQFLGHDLTHQKVLDLGCRHGRMTCLFALLGAEAVGLDLTLSPLALAEARAWGVNDHTTFLTYDGDLDILPNAMFDIIFTKSTLVLIHPLREFLEKLSAKLTIGGKVVCVENRLGSCIMSLMRRIWHPPQDILCPSYFTPLHLSIFANIFDVQLVKSSYIPPIYLICGYKKRSPGSVANFEG
jgi:SAM-dependent methyltransferase